MEGRRSVAQGEPERQLEMDTIKTQDFLKSAAGDLDRDAASGPTLVAQGTFGCIFRPAMSCGALAGGTDYITKLSRASDAAHESMISAAVREIPRYEDMFCPIETSCAAEVGSLVEKQPEIYEYCDVLQKNMSCAREGPVGEMKCDASGAEFVYSNVRYVGARNLYDFFEEGGTSRPLGPPFGREVVLDMFRYLLNSLRMLYDSGGIVHYDLKGNNILIHDVTLLPIVIDFGISVVAGEAGASWDKLRGAFYAYDTEYDVWSPEICLICYFVNTIKNEIKAAAGAGDGEALLGAAVVEADLVTVVQDFMKHVMFDFFDIDKDRYGGELLELWKGYVGKTRREVVADLLLGARSWDIFALCMCFQKANKQFDLGIDAGVFLAGMDASAKNREVMYKDAGKVE